MRVTMLKTETGRWPGYLPDASGYHCLKGHTYDVPDALGRAWVAAEPPVARLADADAPGPRSGPQAPLSVQIVEPEEVE